MRYDSETGLYWMSVRAYDPTLGRFISHDPLGRLAAEGIDFAPYVYTGNNPVVKVDPSGERAVYCDPQFDSNCGPNGKPNGPTGNTNKLPDPCPIGPQYFNNCKYTSGECQGLAYDQCQAKQQADRAAEQQREQAGQKKALPIAHNASRLFAFLSTALGIIGISLGLLGTTMLLGGPILFAWGMLIDGIAMGLGILAFKASQLSNDFSQEVDSGLSWFTHANVDSTKNQMLEMLAGLTIPSLGTSFLMGKIGGIIEQGFRVTAQKAGQGLIDITASSGSISLGGLSFFATDFLGTAIFAKMAIDDASQMDSVLRT